MEIFLAASSSETSLMASAKLVPKRTTVEEDTIMQWTRPFERRLVLIQEVTAKVTKNKG